MAFSRLLAILAAVPALVSATNAKGKEFLEENAKKEGVVTLPSGLQYKVLNKGDGKYHPTVSSPCECHYEGKLIDGTKFDSSYDRGQPTTFAPNQVIKGWTEAMQLMVEGDKWEMYIPSELGYGDSGSPPKIGGGEVLVFQMEILKINGDKVKAVSCNPFTGEECTQKEKDFVAKWYKVKTVEEQKAEVERLEKMQAENKTTKNLTKKQRLWLDGRVKIMAKIIEGPGDADAEKKEEL